MTSIEKNVAIAEMLGHIVKNKIIVILIAYEIIKWAIRKLFDKIVNND
jgi:hypothetical protein